MDKASQRLPIAPHWNWNLCRLQLRARPERTTNRTTLELKHEITNITNGEATPTNRTTLELKHNEDTFIFASRDYQSHHTGIETP